MTEPAIDGGGAAPEAKPNPFAMMFGALFSPAETFSSAARRPVWLVPMIVYVLLSIAGTVLVMPKIDFESVVREQMEKSGQEIDDKQLEMIVSIQKPVIYASAVVAIPIAILIVGALTFFPALAMGPIAEHLMMIR